MNTVLFIHDNCYSLSQEHARVLNLEFLNVKFYYFCLSNLEEKNNPHGRKDMYLKLAGVLFEDCCSFRREFNWGCFSRHAENTQC